MFVFFICIQIWVFIYLYKLIFYFNIICCLLYYTYCLWKLSSSHTNTILMFIENRFLFESVKCLFTLNLFLLKIETSLPNFSRFSRNEVSIIHMQIIAEKKKIIHDQINLLRYVGFVLHVKMTKAAMLTHGENHRRIKTYFSWPV